MTNQTHTYAEWRKALDNYIVSIEHDTQENLDTYGDDFFKEYYDDGYTPEEAYKEDLTYL